MVNLLTKVGELTQSCPRCGATSSVEVNSLSPMMRTLAVLAVLSLLAAGWLDPTREWIYSILVAGVTGIAILLGQRVACRACGARLVRELGGDWR